MQQCEENGWQEEVYEVQEVRGRLQAELMQTIGSISCDEHLSTNIYVI